MLTTATQTKHHRPTTALEQSHKQCSDTMAAFKAAMRLVDVLRRQQVHAEAAKLLRLCAEELDGAGAEPA